MRAVPAVVFTDPEVAYCGLTETEAKRQNREVKVVKFPWVGSGRAMTLGRTEGLTKLVLDPEGDRVLGVGIVGVEAGEMIAEAMLAIEMSASARDVALTMHAIRRCRKRSWRRRIAVRAGPAHAAEEVKSVDSGDGLPTSQEPEGAQRAGAKQTQEQCGRLRSDGNRRRQETLVIIVAELADHLAGALIPWGWC